MIEPLDLQHRKLGETTDRLRCLIAEHGPNANRTWDRRVAGLLAEFESRFRSYIEAKNRGGFLQPVLDQRPTKARVVDRLGRRHERVIDSLHRIRTSADAPGRGQQTVPAGDSERIKRLLDEIVRLEQEENDLVQNVFCTEIGYPASC